MLKEWEHNCRLLEAIMRDISNEELLQEGYSPEELKDARQCLAYLREEKQEAESRKKGRLTQKKAEEMIKKSGGYLHVIGPGIRELPEGLRPTHLLLEDADIEFLPEDLVVENDLIIINCRNLKKLPEDLIIGGTIRIENSGLSELPDCLVVGKDLILDGRNIQNLPRGLVIGGNLELKNTGIREVPGDIRFGGKIIGDVDTSALSVINHMNSGCRTEGSYLYVDGILTHIQHSKRDGPYILYPGKIRKKNIVCDRICYVHCPSFRRGMQELRYKEWMNKDKREIIEKTQLLIGLCFDKDFTDDVMENEVNDVPFFVEVADRVTERKDYILHKEHHAGMVRDAITEIFKERYQDIFGQQKS